MVTPKRQGKVQFNAFIIPLLAVRGICQLGCLQYGLEGVHCSFFYSLSQQPVT